MYMYTYRLQAHRMSMRVCVFLRVAYVYTQATGENY